VANTSLIVFLPVVSAFLGAIIGAWANSWYRNREAEKARDEEREGLLILLSIEVANNNRLFKGFLQHRDDDPNIDERATIAAALQSAAWDESKVRFAQLLISRTYLEDAARYYMRIQIVRLEWTEPRWPLSEDDEERARSIREDGMGIIRDAQDYISDPEFTAPLLKDEDL
jgi:hypothetical protein